MNSALNFMKIPIYVIDNLNVSFLTILNLISPA